MSELALTLLRLGFLLLLWLFVFFVVSALRRDLAAPAEAPIAGTTTAPPKESRRRRAKNSARKLVVVEGSLAGTVVPLALDEHWLAAHRWLDDDGRVARVESTTAWAAVGEAEATHVEVEAMAWEVPVAGAPACGRGTVDTSTPRCVR